MSRERRSSLAALALCGGVLVSSGQDWILKELSGDYPLHEAIVIRCLVALPLLLALVQAQGGLGDLWSPRLKWLLLRGLALVVAYLTFYLAFPVMPLANAVSLFFTAPLFITGLARPLLGETVGAKRWGATSLGFIGILLVVRPRADAFDPTSLLPVASAVAYGASAVMARRLGITESAAVMSVYQNLMFLVAALVMAALFGNGDFAASDHPSAAFLFRAWSMPGPLDLSMLASCGVIAAIATVLLAQAYRMAESSFVATFEYSAILWAILAGYVFWGEVPAPSTLLGAALIVGAGVYAFDRSPSEVRSFRDRSNEFAS